MITTMFTAFARICLFGSILGWQVATAELSMLTENPWIGYHAVFENRNFQAQINQNGKITMLPIGKRGGPISKKLAVSIEIGIEEIQPSGATVIKGIQPKSLESTYPATSKLEKTTFKGKVSGEATFEATVEQKNGTISVGGRILNPGSLTKNPIRFVVSVKFPSCFPNDKKSNDKKQKRSRDQKTSDDRIVLKWADGKRLKLDVGKDTSAASKELKSPGLASAVIDISSYQDKKWTITASEDSAMTLSNSSLRPLYNGFTINWLPDPNKDPEARARLNIQLR